MIHEPLPAYPVKNLLTHWFKPRTKLHSQWGMVWWSEWCRLEAERQNRLCKRNKVIVVTQGEWMALERV
jgi:hypothetical protein